MHLSLQRYRLICAWQPSHTSHHSARTWIGSAISVTLEISSAWAHPNAPTKWQTFDSPRSRPWDPVLRLGVLFDIKINRPGRLPTEI